MAVQADDVAEPRVLPRTLPGATVLQIIPALHDNTIGRATVDVARALIHAGARAIVAAQEGVLADELRSFGGEWLPFANATASPLRLRKNADKLATFITQERIDIVHAKSAGAAWSAQHAIGAGPTRLVTELPDLPRSQMWLAALYPGALSRGHRIIARSLFNAQPMIQRYGIPPERVSIIPRSVDTAAFDPTKVQPPNVAAMRQSWGIPSGTRIIMAPGHIAPANGQIQLVEAARALRDHPHSLSFVLVGDDRRHPRYVRTIMKKAREAGVDTLFRMPGPVGDMPTAYAAATVVAAPYVTPPVYGRVVAEAQAMARPVIATSVGPLAEMLLAPPRAPQQERTGWLVSPGEPTELARALTEALALDTASYRSVAVRARQYAELTFAPHRFAAATLTVYASLLEQEASEPAVRDTGEPVSPPPIAS